MRPKRSSDESIRTSGSGDEFEDPLKNFAPATYDDELERSLAEDPVTVMEHTPFDMETFRTWLQFSLDPAALRRVRCL